MKVVCDNCQAIYKIADHKLVKEINRATCKRCGHKIIIFQHNPASARSTLLGNVPPVGEAQDALAATGQSNANTAEDIEKLAQMTNGGLPSLGSLTKELRAISAPPAIPAATPIGPSAQGAVPPAGPVTPPVSPSIPGLNPQDATGSSPVVADSGNGGSAPIPPSTASTSPGIPASDSPDTRVYRGPAPSGPVLSAAASQNAAVVPPQAPVGENDPTRPIPYAQPFPPATPAPPPASVSVPQYSATTQPGLQSNTSVTQIEHQGSPLLGTAGVLGAVSFLGLLLIILVPGPIAVLGFALAGFGAAGTMALALVTEKGRWPSKMPVGLVLGAAMGLGCGGLALAIQSLDSPPPVAGVAELSEAPAPQAPVVAQATETSAAAEGTVDASADSEAAMNDSSAVEEEASAPIPVTKPKAVSTPEPKRSSSRTTRASTRSSSPPQLPGLSEEGRAQLQNYASSGGTIGSTEPRSSRRGSSTSRSREGRGGDSDKLARSESSSSYSGSRGRTSSSSSVSSSKRRTAPKAPKEKSGSKSSSNAPNQFIIKTIIGSNKSIKRCISSQRARDPDLSGKIYVKFKISPSGSVSRARVTTSRYAGTALDTCISREVNALQFPPFEGKTQNITYPLLVIGD